jgi:hypothetical protein
MARKSAEQAGPGAEAAVHALGVAPASSTELAEEAQHAEVLGVDGVADGEEAVVLGVEHEDEAEETVRRPR